MLIVLLFIAYHFLATGLPLAKGKHYAGRATGHVGIVAFVKAQLGKPYVYGAQGPGAFDCSGLVYAAMHGGPRTSEQQWAQLRHVSAPGPGDLVYFTGSSIDAPPGHVGIVVNPGRHLMIDAYASGYPVEYDTYGAGASKLSLSQPWGFTVP